MWTAIHEISVLLDDCGLGTGHQADIVMNRREDVASMAPMLLRKGR